MKLFKKIALIAALIIPAMVLSSCGNENNTLSSDSLKLTATYSESSDFIADGIGMATLSQNTDGDTATFNLVNTKSASTVAIRFYSIDTPESTGTVDKWGKMASKFTASKLTKDTKIVLEATTSPASHDSYGTRYLGYVWYKNEGMSDYKNLNVEVVENGYSKIDTAKVTDKYYTYFKDALSYAKSNLLHIWSNDEDQYYNDIPYEVSLKDLKSALATGSSKYYDEEEGVGYRVRFTAYVQTHTTSGSASSVSNYYTAAYREADGTITTMPLYGGYNSDLINSNLKVGYLYSFVGSIQKNSSGFQISIGGTYVALETGVNLTSRVQKDYLVKFDSTDTNYTTNPVSSFRSDVTITEVNVNSDKTLLTITATGYDSIKDFDNAESQTYTFTVAITSSTNISSITVGKKMRTSAYQLVEKSNVFEIASFSDIVLK